MLIVFGKGVVNIKYIKRQFNKWYNIVNKM